MLSRKAPPHWGLQILSTEGNRDCTLVHTLAHAVVPFAPVPDFWGLERLAIQRARLLCIVLAPRRNPLIPFVVPTVFTDLAFTAPS